LRNRRETFQKTICPVEQAFLFRKCSAVSGGQLPLGDVPSGYTEKESACALYIGVLPVFALATSYRKNQHSQWYLLISTVLNSSTMKIGLGDPDSVERQDIYNMSRSNPKNSKFSPWQKCECWFVVGSPERKVDTHATLVCIKVICKVRKR